MLFCGVCFWTKTTTKSTTSRERENQKWAYELRSTPLHSTRSCVNAILTSRTHYKIVIANRFQSRFVSSRLVSLSVGVPSLVRSPYFFLVFFFIIRLLCVGTYSILQLVCNGICSLLNEDLNSNNKKELLHERSGVFFSHFFFVWLLKSKRINRKSGYFSRFASVSTTNYRQHRNVGCTGI